MLTQHDLIKFLNRRPQTMDTLVRRYGYAPIVEAMREISNTTETPVLHAPAWQEGQVLAYWIQPAKLTAKWRRWFARLQVDVEEAQVL